MIELACQWKVFWLTGVEIYKACKNILSRLQESRHKYGPLTEEEDLKVDQAINGGIKMWMWLPGLIAVLILTCVVSKLQFDIPVASSILSLVLAFTFSVIAIQSTGATGMYSHPYTISEEDTM